MTVFVNGFELTKFSTDRRRPINSRNAWMKARHQPFPNTCRDRWYIVKWVWDNHELRLSDREEILQYGGQWPPHPETASDGPTCSSTSRMNYPGAHSHDDIAYQWRVHCIYQNYQQKLNAVGSMYSRSTRCLQSLASQPYLAVFFSPSCSSHRK